MEVAQQESGDRNQLNAGPAHPGQGMNSDPLKDAPDLSTLSGPTLTALIQKLPTVDLHRHLEGAIEPEFLLELAKRHPIPLPAGDLDSLRPHIQVTDQDKSLLDFLRKFEPIGKIFTSPEVIRDLTYYAIKEASKDNVKYLELRFSPVYMAAAHQLAVDDVMNGVISGVQKAASLDTRVNLILICERQLGIESAWVVEKTAEKYHDRGVVALDLANDEYNYPPGPYAAVFQAAKTAGLKVTVHAGEAAGPDNVRVSVEQLKADRIGHGTRTYQDPAVEEMICKLGIPLEVCLTSNAQTGAVDKIEMHPLPDYLRKNIIVTLNTDDPGVSAMKLSTDYEKAVQLFKLSLDDLLKITLNGVNAAFLPDSEKIVLAERVKKGFEDAAEWLQAQGGN